MSKVKTPKTLNELLNQKATTQNSLSAYRQKSEKFIQIQAILADNLAVNMAQNIIVSNYKSSIIYLETHSAAVATSFKMYQSQLLTTFRKQFDPALVTIELKISPNATRTASRVKQTERELQHKGEKKQIPEQAVDILKSIAEQSSGELKQKLLKLAEHRNKDKSE